MFNYGKTRAQVTRMHPGSFDLRYFVFVSAFFFLMSLYYLSFSNSQMPLIGSVDLMIPIILNLTYFGIIGLAGVLVGFQTGNVKQGLYAPLVLFIQHFGFSVGLLYGFIRKP